MYAIEDIQENAEVLGVAGMLCEQGGFLLVDPVMIDCVAMYVKSILMLILLVGCQSLAQAMGPVSDIDVRRHNLGLGRSVFTNHCLKCHGAGDFGAPRFGNRDEWEKRLDQPLSTLIAHAIKGHGNMPPKGGFVDLTEREVSAAVAYVVDQGRRLLLDDADPGAESRSVVSGSGNTGCGAGKDILHCEQDGIENTLLIQMLWLLSGQQR